MGPPDSGIAGEEWGKGRGSLEVVEKMEKSRGKKLVNEKGFISFAAQGGRGAETAERLESDETFFIHKELEFICGMFFNGLRVSHSLQSAWRMLA